MPAKKAPAKKAPAKKTPAKKAPARKVALKPAPDTAVVVQDDDGKPGGDIVRA
jgi:hypothetical protein